MDNKLSFLVLFITGCKINLKGKSKKGNNQYNADAIIDLYEKNKKILLKVSKDFPKLNYEEIKSTLKENSFSDLDGNKNLFFKRINNSYKLNKTPASIVRAAAIQVIANNKVSSKNSKYLIKEEIKKKYLLTPADLFDFEHYYNGRKEPIDQLITNVISSNLTNKINSRFFYRKLIDGTKNSYRYHLTNDGYCLYLKIKENEDLKVGSEQNENKELIKKQILEISDKYDRDYKLRKKLIEKIKNKEIYPCELFNEHDPIIVPDGTKYFEGHHIYPNGKSSKSKKINTEKIGNYIAVCPLCHAAIHHGNIQIFKEKMRAAIKIVRVKNFLSEIFNLENEEKIIYKLVELYNKSEE